ncbi:DNA glycosylase AlkZ-like family protein [uncultured Microbacterium sp.]|uniref:DNA glycosylase AlkZ-like family protein n=1 Tax=uncultured Microbacterium sp. TaxID=191216 RepID=UPI0028D29FD2|nr:crosslink repair DNA glycosylase YcaQ family protein [uncultured Microbacterium sp.]
MPRTLTREQARRIAVRAQLLTAERPGGVVEAVDGLWLVNIDPTSAVAPSADHILWSRIGWPYQQADLRRAVEDDRAVFEWAGFYRSMADLPLYRPMMRAWPRYRAQREWLEANDRFRRDVLDRLRAEGPLRGGEIPDTSQVPWKSTGWTNERNVTQMLEFLAMGGAIAVSRREGRDRMWDLAERVYPADLPELSDHEAAALRADRRLGSLGIARAKAIKQPIEPIDVGEAGEEAMIEGVPGSWRVDPAQRDAVSEFEPRTALLSPFDRLVFDRVRAQELFGFEYIVEMYKPAAKRRWGYFALPILHADRLVGKLDASADRKAGLLRVSAIHEDDPFTADMSEAVDAEIRELASWLGLEVTGIPGS